MCLPVYKVPASGKEYTLGIFWSYLVPCVWETGRDLILAYMLCLTIIKDDRICYGILLDSLRGLCSIIVCYREWNFVFKVHDSLVHYRGIQRRTVSLASLMGLTSKVVWNRCGVYIFFHLLAYCSFYSNGNIHHISGVYQECQECCSHCAYTHSLLYSASQYSEEHLTRLIVQSSILRQKGRYLIKGCR